MLATFDALLARPLALLVVLAAGAAIGIAVERFIEGQRRAERRAFWQGRNSATSKVTTLHKNFKSIPLKGTPERATLDAAEQLRRVMEADFKRRPLLNRSEARVFRELDRMVIARNPGWQVMAQVCVGECVTSEDSAAYGCINSKRVDLLLMDETRSARHALEYQGAGHHQGTAAARDAVKKEALRKAGIGYHEIVAGHTTPTELNRLVQKLVPELSLARA